MGHSYRDLIAWQKAIVFVKDVYRETAHFPREEQYGLTSQLRRAAVSVPSNIAEGQGRAFDKEFVRFLSNAMGSLMEAETQITIANELGFMSAKAAERQLSQSAEIGRVINGLMATLQRTAK